MGVFIGKIGKAFIYQATWELVSYIIETDWVGLIKNVRENEDHLSKACVRGQIFHNSNQINSPISGLCMVYIGIPKAKRNSGGKLKQGRND